MVSRHDWPHIRICGSTIKESEAKLRNFNEISIVSEGLSSFFSQLFVIFGKLFEAPCNPANPGFQL
jgi:hypothetical protein